MPIETHARPRLVIRTSSAQGISRFNRFYTPKELAQGGKKKDKTKRPISKTEAEEFWRKL